MGHHPHAVRILQSVQRIVKMDCQPLWRILPDAHTARTQNVDISRIIKYSNIYGIDMPTSEELVAYNRDDLQICKTLGADGLVYQDLDSLVSAAQRGNPEILAFEQSCFTGEYVTGDVTNEYLFKLSKTRSVDRHQSFEDIGGTVTDLFSQMNE